MTVLVILAYAAISVLALRRTLAEQRASQEGGPVERAAGVLACLLWPIVLIPFGAWLLVQGALDRRHVESPRERRSA